MKYEEPDTMKELRRIREKHYEETKDMTLDEKIDYFRKKADDAVKQSGVKLLVSHRSK